MPSAAGWRTPDSKTHTPNSPNLVCTFVGIPGLLTIRPPFHRQEPPPLGDVAAENDDAWWEDIWRENHPNPIKFSGHFWTPVAVARFLGRVPSVVEAPDRR